jgi:hypothetical protein
MITAGALTFVAATGVVAFAANSGPLDSPADSEVGQLDPSGLSGGSASSAPTDLPSPGRTVVVDVTSTDAPDDNGGTRPGGGTADPPGGPLDPSDAPTDRPAADPTSRSSTARPAPTRTHEVGDDHGDDDNVDDNSGSGSDDDSDHDGSDDDSDYDDSDSDDDAGDDRRRGRGRGRGGDDDD